MTNNERRRTTQAQRENYWRRISQLIQLTIVGATCFMPSHRACAETARGTVYHDENGNGLLDGDEAGIPDVRVSNGLEVVSTDANGKYELPVDDDTIVFVVKPRNWQTPLNEQRLPRFFYIHKPAGSPDESFEFAGVEPTGPLPDAIDFPLTPSNEPEDFSVVMMGDPQPYSREQVRFYANDVVAELVDAKAAFGVSLGDIVGDKLTLFEHVNNVQAKVGVPWYNVHGNHDMNYRSPNDQYADETFERVYGPTDYAFQWASVHFIVLDNVLWKGYSTNKAGNVDGGNYIGSLNDEQLQFVRNYVDGVPKTELIVVCVHIPLVNPNSVHHGTRELNQLLAILSKHPHQISFSAHTHYNRHDFVGGPDDSHSADQHASHKQHADHDHAADGADDQHADHSHEESAHEAHAHQEHGEHSHHDHFQLHHHHNAATGSGSWYRGPKDEQGFPMTPMADGAPNGYIIASFSGSDYKLRYKAARMPSDYQMSIHAPESIALSQVATTEILANVFNGNAKSTVKMRVRGYGDWITMTRTQREDPAYRALYERDVADTDRKRNALPAPVATPHMWVATLPPGIEPGVHILDVEATDMFGQLDRGLRLIEVNRDPKRKKPAQKAE